MDPDAVFAYEWWVVLSELGWEARLTWPPVAFTTNDSISLDTKLNTLKRKPPEPESRDECAMDAFEIAAVDSTARGFHGSTWINKDTPDLGNRINSVGCTIHQRY